MDEDNLQSFVDFLENMTKTEITVMNNDMREEELFGAEWRIELFVEAKDSGHSKLFRSKVGPSATLTTEARDEIDGVVMCKQLLCSPMNDGYVTITMNCCNTELVIIEDVS